VAVNPDTNRIYVAQRQNNTVLVIDGARIQQARAAASIGIDVDIDDDDDGSPDNAATSLGTIDSCLSVSSGDTFDVDVFIRGADKLRVWSAAFRYDPSVLSVVDVDARMFLAANSASDVKDQSLGDRGNSGSYDLLVSDVSEEAGVDESGSGVLARITLRAVASGLSTVTVAEPFLFPFQSAETIAGTSIAVDEACGG
jgi:DNA-binding beta-propeller fold protein YncE